MSAWRTSEWVISLGVEVLPGKQHSGRCGMKRLWALIDSLPPHLWPSLLRGDVGYGSDAVMCEAESRGVVYLFKIRRSTHVKFRKFGNPLNLLNPLNQLTTID